MQKRKLIGILLVLIMFCAILPPNVTSAATAWKLNQETLSLIPGEEAEMLLYRYSKKTDGNEILKNKVKWSSSDKSVATVTKKGGKVVAVSPGKCKITGKYKKKTYTCEVTVHEIMSTAWPSSITITDESAWRQMNYDYDELVVFSCAKKGVALTFQIEDVSICECEWDDEWWDCGTYESIDLYIYAKKNGRTKITITNNYRKDRIVIDVIVDKEEFKDSTSTITPTTSPTPTPTPTPTPIPMEIDLSSFDGLTDDGFLFTVKTTSGLSHLSYVKFTKVSYEYSEHYGSIKISYAAESSDATSLNLISSLTYKFNYKLYDSEGYVIQSGDFWLPEMYVGGKVKGSFTIYENLDFGQKYRIFITKDVAY